VDGCCMRASRRGLLNQCRQLEGSNACRRPIREPLSPPPQQTGQTDGDGPLPHALSQHAAVEACIYSGPVLGMSPEHVAGLQVVLFRPNPFFLQ